MKIGMNEGKSYCFVIIVLKMYAISVKKSVRASISYLLM